MREGRRESSIAQAIRGSSLERHIRLCRKEQERRRKCSNAASGMADGRESNEARTGGQVLRNGSSLESGEKWRR